MSDKEGNSKNTGDSSARHSLADEKARDEEPHIPEALSPKAARLLEHELRVRQIELETARTELKASRARYSDLYDFAPVGYCTIDKDGLILDANLAAAALLGVERKTPVNKPVAGFLHPQDWDLCTRHHKQLFETGETQPWEVRLLRKGGTVFWVRVEASLVKNPAGESIGQVVFETIDERKQAELRQRLMIEILAVLNRPLDIETSIRRILSLIKRDTGIDAVGVRLQKDCDFPYFCQEGFSDQFIATENSLIDHIDSGLCCGKNGKVPLACTCGLVLSGQVDPASPLFTPNGSFWVNDSSCLLNIPADQEQRGHRPHRCVHDGYCSLALIPIRQNLQIVGLLQLNARERSFFTSEMISFFEGVSESIGVALAQNQSVMKLREADEIFAQFIEHSPIFCYIKEVVPGESRVLHASDNFRQMIGLSGAEIVGKTMRDLFPAELAEKIIADDQLVVSRGKVLEVEEHLNGRTYISIKFPIVLGSRTLLAGHTIDITDRRQAEEEHTKMEENLRHLQKMEAVGRLAGGVAHDFNNILQIILGNTELLQTLGRMDDTQIRLLESIATAGRRAAELTRQLLEFARKEAGDPELLDVNPTIESMLNPLRALMNGHIDLFWRPALEPCFIKIDRSQLNRVLTSLLINAREAIAGSGQITIGVEPVEYDEAYSPDSPEFMPSPYVRLSVSDTGCGMDKEMIDCIFEPFFTTKPEYLGCGLGLASLYGIIRQNNGFIKVDSQIGQGTTFNIYLPLKGPEKFSHPAQNTRAGPPDTAGTILLVDDEEVLLAICGDHLKRLGYTVLAFKDPDAALEAARNYQGSMDLLLSDVSMPKLQGPELFRRLAVFHPQIRCLFMSGYSSDVLASPQESGAGSFNFLGKPFPLESLTEKVRAVLSQ